MPTIKELGACGAAGALIGIALVIWIEPTTEGGVGVIIAVAILATMVVCGLAKLIFYRKPSQPKAP